MKVYICVSKRATIPLAPCMSTCLSNYEYLLIGSFLSKTSNIFCRDYYWIRTGTALIYEGALRFFSSLLRGEIRARDLTCGRQANLPKSYATLKFSTVCLHGDKFYELLFLCRYISGRGCVAGGAGVQEIPRQNVQVSESFVLEHCLRRGEGREGTGEHAEYHSFLKFNFQVFSCFFYNILWRRVQADAFRNLFYI